MPTLAELRSKASKVKDAGVTRIVNTKDKMTSQPSKNINWHAEIKPKPPPPAKPEYRPPPPPSRTSSSTSSASAQSKAPAPPVPVRRAGSSASSSLARSASATSQASNVSPSPPPRPPPRSIHSAASHSVSPSPPPSTASSNHAGPPPPIRRETRPDLAPPAPRPALSAAKVHDTAADIDRIDWTNLSPEDKQAFFTWLDEFFSRYLGRPVGSQDTTSSTYGAKAAVSGYAPPPKISVASRPAMPSRPSMTEGPITSYPPHPERGSSAEDLAHYFSPTTHWPSAWYTEENLVPPPLRGNQHLTWTGSWWSDGRTKTLAVGVLFADLSMCWYTVAFPPHLTPNTPHDPNDARTVQRHAAYLPRPAPWDPERLVAAHETYGETIASFAESFEGTGRHCARGECWDLANEAIKSFEQYDWVPKPVPSISRTHGHLIYEGRAADKGRTQVGRWRGGDDRVRRGDIVEWRKARVSRGPYAWSTLGDPDHTAVIVRDMVPRTAVKDGMAVPPRELGTLEVVEQGVTSPPKRERYDLSQFEEGEVWIYRPVGMVEYLGTLLTAKCPEDVDALTV
ncbi:hypothetical protein PYCCODRAFT_1434125 [Trametes coccinea BRFM310]|uniref:BBC1/AIM3 cysteine proteinase-fold domain-containing protein n=1 Tax=Trametes coccinea (strain BRFM310) TaxID=1353009 RepID=A0A1Y2IRK5_TRAC3|nr:hypothetical protein PYCCODRAFT_1434125 [Trametes coccinea BRFM310]